MFIDLVNTDGNKFTVNKMHIIEICHKTKTVYMTDQDNFYLNEKEFIDFLFRLKQENHI